MSQKTTIIHIYRSLLRSASYLPDSLARVRVHNEIVHRFHKHKHSKKHASSPAQSKRLASTLKKQATKLQRAADLHADDLKSVLMFTYGRKGTRRRALMSELVAEPNLDIPQDTQDLETFISQAQNPQKTRSRHGDNKKLEALVKSQKDNASHAESGKIKDIKPKIPTHNIWMRPTPLKVRANKEKRFWAMTLAKVCPPCGAEDWERLRLLASGLLVEAKPQRRCQCQTTVGSRDEGGASDDLGMWLRRVRGGREKIRILSPRGLRRVYSTIWTQSPLMTVDPDSKQWQIQWGVGNALLKAGKDAVRRVSGAELELFEGMENLQRKDETKTRRKNSA